MVATIILLAIMFVDFGIHLAKHGEYRDDRYNAWIALIALIINIVLLYFAGVFDNFK